MLQFGLLAIPAVMTLLITGGMVVYAVRGVADRERGDRRLLALFALMNAFGALFAAFVTLQLVIADPGIQALLIRLSGAVSPFGWAMVCLGLFAIEYTGRSHWISRPYFALLTAVVLIYVAALVVHGPSWVPGGTITVGSLTVTEIAHNSTRIYRYIQLFAISHHLLAIGLFGSLLFSSQPIYRKQGAVMTAGAVGVIAIGLPIEKFTDYPSMYVTLAHFIPFAVFGLGLYRYKLVEYVPVVRKNVIQEMNEGYLVVDDRGTIVDHNPTVVSLLHHEGGLIGASIEEVLPESEPLLDGGTAESVTVEAGEGGRFLSVTASDVASANRTGQLLLVSDVTELEERERDLDLLKQVLTRVFRHNIRNEIGIVRGHAEWLDAQLDSELSTHTKTILQTSDRILGHSEKARRIERVVDDDQLVELDLTAEVEAILATAREVHPAATFTSTLDGVPSVRAHPEISAAIEEIVENAVEHAPAGEPARVSIWAESSAETVTLFVEDESGGLDAHEIEVLDRGEETELEHGSGVGLWLVQWVMDRSNGTLLAEPTGEGTRIELELRRADVEPVTNTEGVDQLPVD